MANKNKCCEVVAVLLIMVVFLDGGAAAAGRKVGGRMQLKNVEDNKEVQELGRYCVREYNRHKLLANSSEKLLVFSRVVEAQVQVVSGIKYYLKISAAAAAGPPQTFHAVVVVKPWLRSKVLIDFTPSQTPTTSTN